MKVLAALAVLFFAACLQATEAESWDKDIGKPAPALVAAGWMGTPVSMDAVKGNTLVIGFWNADIPC